MTVRTLDAGVISRTQFQVGAWRVNGTANELSRDGQTVRIEPKAMEVLMVLAGHAGCAVSRERLLATVWPGVVVSDEVLTQSIIKLRRTLGDNPRSPVYIETISKRGYRLIAAVRPDAEVLAVPAAIDLINTARRLLRQRAPLTGFVAALTLAAAVLAVILSRVISPPTVDADVIAVATSPATPTVGVLPFQQLGADGSQAYLARGIRDALITDLAQVPSLRLIDVPGDARDAGPARTARYLVAGSVEHDSSTLQIDIHLIDAVSNQEIWSQRFEQPVADSLTMQIEIARRVTSILPGKLAAVARMQRATRYTRSSDAYDSFLHGQALLLVRQAGDNDAARALYRNAVALDPNFARAYAGLAMTYAMDYRLRPSTGTSSALSRAMELANTARLIDPRIPEVYWALAFVCVQSRHHAQAIGYLQSAIEHDRSFADAYALLGGIYTYTGDAAKSIPLLRTAMRLNPDGGHLYFLLLGRAYLFQNDIEQALINLREASRRDPGDLETRLYLAAALVAAGDRQDATWEVEEIRMADGGFSLHQWLQTYPLSSIRYRTKLEQLLAMADL
ncbi:MAG: winged helix-turn-helix domain-containing protein [Casimicrobiaceae bacterium]